MFTHIVTSKVAGVFLYPKPEFWYMNTASHFSQLNIKFLSERSIFNDLAQTTPEPQWLKNGAAFGTAFSDKEKYGTTYGATQNT